MTSGGTFRVRNELTHAGSVVADRSQSIFDTLQDLRRRVSQLATTWTGSGASESYQQLQQDWDTASGNLFGDGTRSPDSILGSIAYNLDRIADNWATTEHGNKKIWLT